MRLGSISSDVPVMEPRPNPNTTAIVHCTHTGNGAEAESQFPTSKINIEAPVVGSVFTLCSPLAGPTVAIDSAHVNMGALIDPGV